MALSASLLAAEAVLHPPAASPSHHSTRARRRTASSDWIACRPYPRGGTLTSRQVPGWSRPATTPGLPRDLVQCQAVQPRAEGSLLEEGFLPAPERVPSRRAQEVLSLGDLSGPEELPPLEVDGDVDILGDPGSNPLQSAASVLLTGALTLILARTFRRRLAKAKEERLRSDVVERLSPKQAELQKAKADLAAASAAEPSTSAEPPNPLSLLSGAVVAGMLSYAAYSFTTGVDENFAQQSVSSNYTVRQITITVRTIISGMGWLATGVFGANSLGLTLYAIQIALGLDKETREKNSSGNIAEKTDTKDVEEEKSKL